MKKITTIFSFVIISHFLHAQVDTSAILEFALVEGERMTKALHSNEYDVFVEFSHPKLIEMVGGKEKMKDMLNEQNDIKQMENMLISTELSLPEKLIIQDNIYQCSFLQKQIMSFDGQKYYGLSTLVGVSHNAGKQWFFIAATKSLEEMQAVFSELSDNLNVIEQTAPIILIE